MSNDRLAELGRLADRVDRERQGGDAWVQFYRVLYDAAENPELVRLIEELRSRVGRYLPSERVISDRSRGHGELAWLDEHLANVSPRRCRPRHRRR